jgi:hypothetical protein
MIRAGNAPAEVIADVKSIPLHSECHDLHSRASPRLAASLFLRYLSQQN